jgi:hypothetical protein
MSNFSFTDNTGDGSTATFSFSFVGQGKGYIRDSDVHVFVDGVEALFVLSGDNQVTLLAPPSDGSLVRIRRIVPKDKPYADFSRGNAFTQDLLNKSFLQTLYAYHEFLDGFVDGDEFYLKAKLFLTSLDLSGGKITSLGDATSDTDAVNLKLLTKQYDDIISLLNIYSGSDLAFAALAESNSVVPVGGVPAGNIAKRTANYLTPEEFGAVGDGVADDTTPALNWLTALAANTKLTGLANKDYRINFISVNAVNGLTVIGSGTFKALGSTRLGMVLIANVQGLISIDGVTFDGNDIVARPFEIKNIGTAGVGDVYIGSSASFINAKNVSPRTDNASAIRIQGAFNSVVFEGEVNGVDNNLTSGAVSVGAWFDWSGADFINRVLVTSKARIKNVKNDNTTTADADGMQRMGPTTETLSFTVESGAYFENCKGRSIKSQVTDNAITGPIIVRNAYDGLVEIDCQYSGGYCVGARLFYDGVRVENVISSATRINLPSNFTMRDNVLTILSPAASNTDSMCFFWGTDNTDSIAQDGLICAGNKVIGGSVNHMATVYATNVINTNRAIIKDNWSDGVAGSYVSVQLVFNSPAQLSVVFEGNGCKSPCAGAEVVAGGQLRVESDRCNSKISPLIPYQEAIVGGVLTIYTGNLIPVATEGGSGFDDIDTISGANYSAGDTVMFRMWTPTQRPTFKNGTGNIFLAGSDFELNNMRDTLVLSYDAANNEWHEVSRANNGA